MISRRFPAVALTLVGLIAVPAIAASPGQAAPSIQSNTTVMTFVLDGANLKPVKAVAPATKGNGSLTFPVTSASGGKITNSGGIKISTFVAMDPVIIMSADRKSARINFTIDGTVAELLTVKNIKAVEGMRSVWQGDLHVTNDNATVTFLNSLIPGAHLFPGSRMGQIKVAIRK